VSKISFADHGGVDLSGHQPRERTSLLRRHASAGSALAALALAGCAGFQPLYGEQATVKGLAGVQVHAPQGRTGYLLGQHLEDAFARDLSAAPAYSMDLTIGEARYPRGVRIDNVATRYEYVLTARYTLRSQPSNAAIKDGQVRVEVTYDSPDQPYASIVGQQDAADRAAEEAARRIELDLATWLASNRPKVASAAK
jgi:LPS-assembly lipoprotein